MKKCVVVSSQKVTNSMLRYVPPDAYIIAADAGWMRAMEIGLKPHLVVGDFDSACMPDGCKVIQLAKEKDDTDTLFAVKEALRLGAEEIIMLGGLGGRADHTCANLQVLLYIAKQGVNNILVNEDTEIRCIAPGTLRIERQKNRSISVFAADGIVRGVTLTGLKYPLHDATLFSDTPIGVSNEFVEQYATIRCTEGYLYVYTCELE